MFRVCGIFIVLVCFAWEINGFAIDKTTVKDYNTNKIGSRIINGTDAPDGAFPYQVSLRRRNNQHFCGGSIINDQWILTAAHCLAGIFAPENFFVVVGSNKLDRGGEAYQPIKIIWHRDYNQAFVTNDIGLIKVAGTIKYREFVQPIALPPHNIDINNHPAVVSGWGVVQENTIFPSNNLQYYNTLLLDQETCKTIVDNITDENICSLTQLGQGNCFGDSGSPLVTDGYQIGIVSFVVGGCAGGYPDVYARVWTFLDWIHDNIKNNSN